MSVAEIVEQARGLTPNERVELIARLQELLPEAQHTPKHSILELDGLGVGIWQGIDAQKYVEQMRADWDKEQ
jgi:hypothetical protein